jgi:phosphatidylserine decarboxylase
MPELDKPNSHLTAVKWRFPSVHPEGRKFTLIAALPRCRLTAGSHFSAGC